MPDWPADTVERRDTETLLAYSKNARSHSSAQIKQIARSIEQWGWTMPVLVDESGMLIAGHARVEAARKLRLPQVPVMVARNWTDEQKRAYVIADNKLALNSSWNDDTLKMELGGLQMAGWDLTLTGFDMDEVDDILGLGPSQGTGDAEAVPEVPPVPISQVGDVWLCGRHRVMCGDATSPADITKLTRGEAIDVLLTDPPYCSGGFQEAGRASGSVGTRGDEMVANDTLSTRGYMALMKAVVSGFGTGVVYIFTDWRMWINLFDVVESSGYGVRNMIVWDKGTPGMGVGWRMQHELIMCGLRVRSPFSPQKAQGNVIQAKRTGNLLHAVQKPVDLLTTIIDVTDLARTVADPFAGSGGTLIAAEQTGRVAYCMEITPGYTDVCVQRWEQFTGQTATREVANGGQPA
jgi:DNA modification methylase